MSTTVFPPVDEQTLQRARDLAARQSGGLPSKRLLMRELNVALPKASAVLERLSAERDRRRSDALRAMRRLRGRAGERHPAKVLAARSRGVSAVPVSPGVGPAAPVVSPQVAARVNTVAAPGGTVARRPSAWPILILALPAFVAIWSGWVDLGRLTGFGVVHPLPGIADHVALNTAITLPIGLETYAAYALSVWLSGAVPDRARAFAKWSALGSLGLGAAGQIAYHLMAAAGMGRAPWQITTIVACLPVAVLGMGAALHHLVRSE